MKKDTKLLIRTTLVCLLPIVLGLAMYNILPDRIGDENNSMPKSIGIWIAPVILAATNVFIYFLFALDCKRKNVAVQEKKIVLYILPFASIIINPVMLFDTIGFNSSVEIILPSLIGVVLIACGNYLPKCRQNHTVGIRVPWALKDADNWNKTNRLAGYLMMIGGLVLILLSFAKYDFVSSITIIALITVIVPTIYSYMIYRRSKS